MNPSGILNVNKPTGWTSFDAVRFVRSRSRERRVGHAGTLDPAATGVLPVLLGQATRLTEYLMDATKEYLATIRLGVETDTYDATGQVLHRTDASALGEDALRAALGGFLGDIMQAPPAYSAVKREGIPLYKRARRGEQVETTPRPVRVEALELISYQPPRLELRVVCGKGFYVRSLAHDLGRRLGVGGMLEALVRTRVGGFAVEDAVDVETLRQEFETGDWLDRVFALDEVLLDWRAAIVGPSTALRLRHGNTTSFRTNPGARLQSGDLCRAYSEEGEFLAVLRHAGSHTWHPEKVFGAAPPPG